MRVFLIFIFLVSCFFVSNAQQDVSVGGLSKIELGFGGVGFERDAKLSDKLVLGIGAGAMGSYEIESNSLKYIFVGSQYTVPAIYLSVNPKYYYNLEKRAGKGKKTLNNSANYFGIRARFAINFDYFSSWVLANAHWGMQRSLGNKWLFNTHAGVGVAADTGGIFVPYPAIDFRFAYILSKVKK